MINLKDENQIHLGQLEDGCGYDNDCSYVKIVLDVELPEDYDESEVDEVIADVISSEGGQVLNSKEYVKYEHCVKIELEVELPKDYKESVIDNALADAIFNLDGQVIDSKEYKEIIPTNL